MRVLRGWRDLSCWRGLSRWAERRGLRSWTDRRGFDERFERLEVLLRPERLDRRGLTGPRGSGSLSSLSCGRGLRDWGCEKRVERLDREESFERLEML